MTEQTHWPTPITITNAVPDKQSAFGWACVIEKDGKVVFVKQADVIPLEVLEAAAYEFVLSSRENDDMHKRSGTGRLVESCVFTKEKQQSLGIDLKKVAWWVG